MEPKFRSPEWMQRAAEEERRHRREGERLALVLLGAVIAVGILLLFIAYLVQASGVNLYQEGPR